jgi:diamine N-acetyltransferase
MIFNANPPSPVRPETVADQALLVNVRRAVPADAIDLAELAARTFTQAFGAENRPEDLAAHLAESYGERQQRQEIADPNYISLLVVERDALVGFAQLRRQRPPASIATAVGAAQRLMAEAKTAARDLGGCHVWLGVWEQNPRAIAFYLKSGFVERGTKDFMVGTDRQTDRVLVAVV